MPEEEADLEVEISFKDDNIPDKMAMPIVPIVHQSIDHVFWETK